MNKEIIPWCSYNAEEEKIKMTDGRIFQLANGSRVEVFRVVDREALAIRLFRPTKCGRVTLLEFALSEESAAALCKGLIEHFQPKILEPKQPK